jgi:hypothetical protein
MTRSKIFVALTALLALAMMLATTPVLGQEWSAAQKEVWKTVETMWELYGKGDVEGELAYADDELSLWLQDAPLPVNKASFRKWATYGAKVEQTVIYELKPVAILVFPECALVHYYISGVWKSGPLEKGQFGTTRITDVYRNKGGKWVWIGGHNTDVPQK